jgi:hypothetical protein
MRSAVSNKEIEPTAQAPYDAKTASSQANGPQLISKTFDPTPRAFAG